MTPTTPAQPTATELIRATPIVFVDELLLKHVRRADRVYRAQLRRWFVPVIVVEGEGVES
jgi:hypothetical protein